MSEVIGKNESPAICVWCVHKWHYKDFEELDEAYKIIDEVITDEEKS